VALHVTDNHATQPPSSKSSSILAQEKGILSQDIFIYITRVVDITGGKAIAELETALNKMKLKEAAKDQQEGPAITNNSLADMVRKSVQEALRKKKGTNARSNESTSKCKYTDSNCVNSKHEEKRQRKGQGDQKVLKRFLNETQRQGQEETSRSQRRHQFVEDEESKDSEKESEGTWTRSNPSLYPDRLLNIPFNYAVMEIRQRMPLAMLDSLRYRRGVHLLEGVHVSREIEYELSKGFRYMFSSEINSSIVLCNYDSFCNTIRWKCHFKGKDSQSYEPRYDPSTDKPMPAPRASIPVEAGLAEGRSRLLQMIEEAPKAESTMHLGMQSARKLLKYLVDNDLFITSMDKNLGIAITVRHEPNWFEFTPPIPHSPRHSTRHLEAATRPGTRSRFLGDIPSPR